MVFHMCGIIKALDVYIAFYSASNKGSLIVDGRNGMIIFKLAIGSHYIKRLKRQ